MSRDQSTRLKEWHQTALDLGSAVHKTFNIADQLFDRVSTGEDLSEPIDQLFQLREHLIKLGHKLGETRDRALPLPKRGELREWAAHLERLHQLLRQALDAFCLLVPGFVALSAGSSLCDPTGRMADDHILTVYGLQSRQLHREQGWKLGLHLLFRKLMRDWRSYSDYGKSYFKMVIANETRRDARDQDLADRDRLGFTPKDQRRSKDLAPRLRGELNRSAIDPGDVADTLVSPFPDPETALILRERLETALQILDAVVTENQLRLVDKILDGYRPSEALRELGLASSVYNSLINKARRRLPPA